jgi:DNA-binding beta-propeller fold protein YncE
VTPGSATWTVVSGGANLQVTPEGIATAIAEGTATVQVTIDGVTSPAATITTHQPPIKFIVAVPVNDMAYDAVNGKIWATVQPSGGANANSVVGIDPVTGAVGPSILIGPEPNLIAVTDNGQYAYVTVNADNTVRRVDLTSNSVTLIVPVGGQYVDFITIPGSPQSFVGAVDPTGGVNVSVWDDNVRRSGTGAGGNTIVFGGSETVLYGAGGNSLFKNTLTPTAISWVDQTNGLLDATITYSDGLLYTATGRIVDPVAKIVVGQLNSPNFLVDKGIAISESDDRVYFVTWNPTTAKRILVFNKTTRNEIPFFDTGVTQGGATNLIACGSRSVAFSLFGSGVDRHVVICRFLP